MPHEEPGTGALRLRAAVESSPSGLLMVDARGRIVLVNREIERLFGYPREELLGQCVELLVPEAFRDSHEGFRADYLADPQVRSMGAGRDLHGRRKDGSQVPVEIGLTPVATEEGLFVLSSVVDISQRKEAEKERDALEGQLRQIQKMDAVGALAGGIAHDFNNILAAIMGFGELLRDSVQGEQARKDLDELIAFTHRGKSLVQRIQAFGRRYEAGRTPLSLDEPVREVESFLRSSLPPSIEVGASVDPDTPRVFADASAMHQVLMNLGVNGGQAMEAGGRLSIEVGPLYVTDSRARSHPHLREGHHVQISIRDTGVGIDPEIQDRIFEPFFTTKPPGQGSGLGLAIVHGIVREHGGALEVESALGEGTTVRLILPSLDVEGFDEPIEAAPEAMGNGERILYVDDEPGLGEVGRRRLERVGYVVTVATDGEQALKLFKAAPDSFDAVITDHLMPKKNGLSLAAALTRVRPELPVLLLTGRVDDVSDEAIRSSGVGEVLRKPSTSRELTSALAKALGKQVEG